MVKIRTSKSLKRARSATNTGIRNINQHLCAGRKLADFKDLHLDDQKMKRAFRLITKSTLQSLIPNHYEYLHLENSKKITKCLVYNYIRTMFKLFPHDAATFNSLTKSDIEEIFIKHHCNHIKSTPLKVTSVCDAPTQK